VFFIEKVIFFFVSNKALSTTKNLYLMNSSHFIKRSIAYTKSTFVASFENIWKCTRIAVKVHHWW